MMTFVLYLSSYLLLSIWYKWMQKLMYKHRNNNGILTTQSDQLCVSSEWVVMFTADTVVYNVSTAGVGEMQPTM